MHLKVRKYPFKCTGKTRAKQNKSFLSYKKKKKNFRLLKNTFLKVIFRCDYYIRYARRQSALIAPPPPHFPIKPIFKNENKPKQMPKDNVEKKCS